MAVIPVIMIASAALAAAGSIAAANAKSASDKSAAQAANYNATADTQNANASMAAASAAELAQRQQNDVRMGAERAAAGEATGGFVGTTPGLLTQNAASMELSALNTRYNGAMQARGLLSQANLEQYQSKVSMQNAGRDMTAGYIGAAGSALSAYSSYSSAGRSSIGGGGW